MLVWFYTCQNATLLEITCRGPQCIHAPHLSAQWCIFIIAMDSSSRDNESSLDPAYLGLQIQLIWVYTVFPKAGFCTVCVSAENKI